MVEKAVHDFIDCFFSQHPFGKLTLNGENGEVAYLVSQTGIRPHDLRTRIAEMRMVQDAQEKQRRLNKGLLSIKRTMGLAKVNKE